jgi:hypothetical protein
MNFQLTWQMSCKSDELSVDVAEELQVDMADELSVNVAEEP